MYNDPNNPNQNLYNNQTQQNFPTYSQYQQTPIYPPVQTQMPVKRSLFRWYWRQHPLIKVGIGCPAFLVAAFVVLFMVFFVIAIVSPSKASQASHQAAPTHQVAQGHVSTPASKPKTIVAPKPTPKLLPTPTPTPVPVVQVSQPTQPPAPPVSQSTQPSAPPACSGTVDDGVCYSLDSTGGTPVSNPPADFCSYFACVSTFWKDTNGFVVECANGKYSHSGGVSGACSRDGGVVGAVYSH